MTVFMKPPSNLRALRKERSPIRAAVIGFLFGGIGLCVYFKSVIDFLIPMGFAIATTAVVAVTAKQGGIGYLAGAMIAARWGYYRARQSNARLAATQKSGPADVLGEARPAR